MKRTQEKCLHHISVSSLDYPTQPVLFPGNSISVHSLFPVFGCGSWCLLSDWQACLLCLCFILWWDGPNDWPTCKDYPIRIIWVISASGLAWEHLITLMSPSRLLSIMLISGDMFLKTLLTLNLWWSLSKSNQLDYWSKVSGVVGRTFHTRIMFSFLMNWWRWGRPFMAAFSTFNMAFFSIFNMSAQVRFSKFLFFLFFCLDAGLYSKSMERSLGLIAWTGRL